jgi:hypothetical protein
VSLTGTLNLQLTITVKNLEELVEKTNMLVRVMKAEGFVTTPAIGEPKVVRETARGTSTQSLSERSPELIKYAKAPELVEYANSLRDPEAVAFTANVLAFDDTFRSQETDPIWGLAFTSRDITEGKNLGAYLRKKQTVRMIIKKVKDGEQS